ncbi:hypothetical protein FGO68_gene3495 [Halteria grandinella]|uniref:GOLD domain-containing protein n=1 Tax=Halteria grandinella TaxID=5974 RepID=A0A8J8NYA9_HALGN|nr:hypothetical protein FGO68_gene3495 [Halteria grandinella]
MLLALVGLLFVLPAQGLYFYMERDIRKCFKDELVKNSHIEARIRILDPMVSQLMQDKPDYFVDVELTTPDKQVLTLKLKPEELLTYNSTKNGEFRLCIRIDSKVYDDPMGIKSIKTKLFFSNEYYNLNDTKRKPSQPTQEEKDPSGLSPDQLKQAATESHFAPLKNRIKKISSMVGEIIAHQQWEREKEGQFTDKLRRLTGNFFNMVWLQIAIVVGSAAFSVINLRKFFVRKHIF